MIAAIRHWIKGHLRRRSASTPHPHQERLTAAYERYHARKNARDDRGAGEAYPALRAAKHAQLADEVWGR